MIQALKKVTVRHIAAGWGHSLVSGVKSNKTGATFVFGRVHRAGKASSSSAAAAKKGKKGQGNDVGAAAAGDPVPTDDAVTAEPTAVEDLDRMVVAGVAAGGSHCMVVTEPAADGAVDGDGGSGGAVYTWGCGADGRLGHGKYAGGESGSGSGSDSEDEEEDDDEEEGGGGKGKGKGKGAKGGKSGKKAASAAPSSSVPHDISEARHIHEGLKGVVVAAVAAGANSSWAINSDQSVLSWGAGDHGQLGHEKVAPIDKRAPCQSIPKKVSCLLFAKVASVAAGWGHALVLTAVGKVYSMGCNVNGQLGHGDEEGRPAPTLLGKKGDKLLGDTIVEFVACGADHSLAVAADGALFTWGLGDSGQLGHGVDHDELAPKRVAALEKAVSPAGVRLAAKQAAAGFRHSLVLLSDGSVMAFGWRGLGQLGDGVPPPDPPPGQGPETPAKKKKQKTEQGAPAQGGLQNVGRAS